MSETSIASFSMAVQSRANLGGLGSPLLVLQHHRLV